MGKKWIYKYNVGDVINNLVILKQSKYKKTDNKSKKGYHYTKAYDYMCLKCNHEGVKYETSIRENSICPVCKGSITIKDINSLWKTENWMVKYFINIEDTYTHTKSSNERVNLKCPDCGCEKEMRIADLYMYKFSCPQCSDGISYPNKFMFNMLNQIGVKFEAEKTFPWSQNRKYDEYIESKSILIESHGGGHYNDRFSTFGGRDLLEEQSNDIFKKELAYKNGIFNYVVIDCRKSELDFIKNSVMESELPNLLNFKEDDVNWLECHEYACKTIIIEASNLWNNITKSTHDISQKIGVSQATTIKYLKQASDLGWCDYTVSESTKLGRNAGHEKMKRRVMFIEENKDFDSIKELVYYLNNETEYGFNFQNCNISSACSGRYSNSHGLHFMYYEDWLDAQTKVS